MYYVKTIIAKPLNMTSRFFFYQNLKKNIFFQKKSRIRGSNEILYYFESQSSLLYYSAIRQNVLPQRKPIDQMSVNRE